MLRFRRRPRPRSRERQECVRGRRVLRTSRRPAVVSTESEVHARLRSQSWPDDNSERVSLTRTMKTPIRTMTTWRTRKADPLLQCTPQRRRHPTRNNTSLHFHARRETRTIGSQRIPAYMVRRTLHHRLFSLSGYCDASAFASTSHAQRCVQSAKRDNAVCRLSRAHFPADFSPCTIPQCPMHHNTTRSIDSRFFFAG